MLVMKNTTPKPREPADRRQVGGGAGQQLAGLPGVVEAGSSRWRWAYRSSRIDFSMPATAPAWTQRRKKFRKAWSSPKATARKPSSTSSVRFTCRIALSTTDLVSSGIAISADTDSSAAKIMKASRP